MRLVTTLFALTAIIGLSAPATADIMPLTVDFETDGAGTDLLAGQIIDDELAPLGIQITAENYTDGNPDMAIIFDSANPTGEDWDLLTPNPGGHPSNTVPYYNVLIIAEDAVDSDGDGLVDDPDDEGGRPAGYIHFALQSLYTGGDFVLIDTEEAGGTIDFYNGRSIVGSAVIPQTENKGVVSVSYDAAPFDAFRVNLAGSGALGEFVLIPEPASLTLLTLGAVALVARRR